MKKQEYYSIKGMQRDVDISKVSTDLSYENMNIRITANDDNTLLAVTNEKGTSVISGASGVLLGHCIINNYVILFEKILIVDYIYKCYYEEGVFKRVRLFSGKLNFSLEHPIETLGIYESETVQKVYWVDGLNQPRVIDINNVNNINNFDFCNNVNKIPNINIEKLYGTNGIFPAGVVQYAITYYNKYKQETKVIKTSFLNYISSKNNANSPEEVISNSFRIVIDNIDESFDYMRIYSIIRSSINTTPIVKRLIDTDIKSINYTIETKESTNYVSRTKYFEDITLIDNNNNEFKIVEGTPNITFDDSDIYGMRSIYIHPNFYKTIKINNDVIDISTLDGYTYLDRQKYNEYIEIWNDKGRLLNIKEYTKKIIINDSNNLGEIVDSSLLLYVGGDSLIASTITQKDNTLFLGNIKETERVLNESNIDTYRNRISSIPFSFKSSATKTIPQASFNGKYDYKNTLSTDSKNLTTFKYGETYRIGIVLQYKDGSYSPPFSLGDVLNTTRITNNFLNDSTKISLVEGESIIDDGDTFLSTLKELGAVGVLPVIVYPDINDRTVLCQGAINPTVFNVKDRYDNSPFAQSSWFFRPNAPFDVTFNADNPLGDFQNLDNENPMYDGNVESKGGIMSNNKVNVQLEYTTKEVNSIYHGTWLEFRHFFPIPNNNNRNAEIQCISNTANSPLFAAYTNNLSNERKEFVSKHSECYFVDQSIVTMHSPELEFDDRLQSIDLSECKLRIVGMIPITSNENYYDINVEVPTKTPSYQERDLGYINYKITSSSQILNTYRLSGRFGWKSLVSGAFWFDYLESRKSQQFGNDYALQAFMIYPWQTEGSINNGSVSKLKNKTLSNLKYSYNTLYMRIKYSSLDYSSVDYNIRDCKIVTKDTKAVSLTDSQNIERIYYGNIDKLQTYHEVSSEDKGYPLVSSLIDESSASSSSINDFIESTLHQLNPNYITDNSYYRTTGVRIQYNSSNHLVIMTDDIMPTIVDKQSLIKIPINQYDYDDNPFWEGLDSYVATTPYIDTDFSSKKNKDEFYIQDIYDKHPVSIQHGFLWMGELVRENVVNRFGGNTKEALQSNKWIPCGDLVPITNNDKVIKVIWSQGDTYYQRYDHLKTYSNDLNNYNNILETLSFMCETRINIDGIYNKNRGNVKNITINPDNFNLLNPVYSQENNYKTYNILPDYLYANNKYPNLVVWSKEKQMNSLTDTWTNINMVSNIDLDGDKGEITKLTTFNNELYCFQKEGLSNILFNNRIQIPTSDGVPIEISNSNKVQGKRYLSEKIGCNNKHTIINTSSGIYFIDDNTNTLFLFNGQLNNISDNLGFRNWFKENTNKGIWNLNSNNTALRCGYDNINKDLYISNNQQCLCYSELLGQFTSFMSYIGNSGMFNLDNKFISKYGFQLFEHNSGEYNNIYGKYVPYYIEYRIAPEHVKTKIFDNIELSSDSFDSNNVLLNKTFDKIKVSNEYQNAESILNYNNCRPSNLKKRDRIWRINLPRDGRDRIKNPWINLRLESTIENNKDNHKSIIHNMIMSYYY